MINIDLQNDKKEMTNDGFLKEEMLYVVSAYMEQCLKKAGGNLIAAEFFFKMELDSYGGFYSKQKQESTTLKNGKDLDLDLKSLFF